MKHVYAPGCALTIYKPHLAEKMHEIMNNTLGEMERLDICCRNHPDISDGAQVINTCPGCDRRYKQNYAESTTISVWEVLAKSSFPFPNYHGQKMTILDACPTRDQSRVHNAIRTLLQKMNIQIIEPEKTRTTGTCCGDSYYGSLSVGEVKEMMQKRASEMPVTDVVVYCVSCSQSMYIGGKKPHYLVDLLFGEETTPKALDPDEWHRELDEYSNIHTSCD
ncbi:MAG: heterodisulfide reductase-related iron-sulfur binding cluster [Candidatus Bathyarchaeota archaeon]